MGLDRGEERRQKAEKEEKRFGEKITEELKTLVILEKGKGFVCVEEN